MRRYYKNIDGFEEKDEWEPECWINIECPDSRDLYFLRESIGVPESFLESASDNDERPRFDHEDGWLLTILRLPIRLPGNGYFNTVTLAVITKEEILITISHDKTEMIDDFIDHTKKRHLTIINKPDFILRMLYSSTYWFLNYLKEIRTVVSEGVDTVRRKVSNDDLYGLMQIQKSLVYFNTALRGNMTLVERINRMFADDCNPDLLEDVEIEMQQAQNTVSVYAEIVDSTMDTLSSVISNNVNEIMKKMTSVSIILMLPTLIASFYGMNVAVAFGETKNAFWLIIGMSMLIAFVIFLVLRRIKWL